jgi:dedicator of cytokinesis protein 3
MPWQPLPRIAFAVATYPFQASSPADLPLELGDELYIIEEGGKDGAWFRGYLIAPPSLLAGLTSVKGQTLEARVFSGIFPRSCVEVREVLGEANEINDGEEDANAYPNDLTNGLTTPSGSDGSANSLNKIAKKLVKDGRAEKTSSRSKGQFSSSNGVSTPLSIVTKRDPSGAKPPAPVPMLKIGDETPTSESEPLVDEIASCLREWHSTNLHGLLLSRQYPLLEKMTSLVRRLDLSRRQFLHNVLTNHELDTLREKTVWDLVKGNKLFNGEVIVRDPAERGRVLTGDDSAVEVTKLQSMMSLLDERPQPAIENIALHHILIDVKTFVGGSNDSTTLVFYLASKKPGATAVALSESYIANIPANGSLASLPKSGQIRTLFTDLGPADIGDAPFADTELFLVVKVRQTQQTVASRNSDSRGAAASRDDLPSTNTPDKPSSSSGSKSARRSLMWGRSPQLSRNSPISKLQTVSEQSDASLESRDGQRPTTGGSRGNGDHGKAAKFNQMVTRTVGVGAIKLNSIMKQDEEVEQGISLWSPSTRFDEEKPVHGEGWEDVIRDLMKSKTGRYDKSAKSERLQLQLRPFTSPDAESLIKATPTLLSDITRTNKMGFSGAPTKPRSDIYITIDEAFLPRHALLSRSTGSAAPVSSNLGSNMQLTMEVRRSNGERIENCIYTSSNSEAASTWESTAAERGTSWNETIRLVVPTADVSATHIVLALADVPHQPFAICHMPLWDQQAFLRDGYHSLLLYKYDDTSSSPHPNQNGKGGYLWLRWNARNNDDISKEEAVTGPIATLRLQTYLCSTRFSQDKVLLKLLKWKEQPPESLLELLKQVVFVPEIEIVKLLNDVFDAIFGILVDHAGNDEYEDLVFSALVTVLGIVHDRRFNLGPLVDQYAETMFNYPFATPCLIRSFTRLLADPADPEVSRKLRATFKVVRHILKFITHARDQQKVKEAGIGITSTSHGFSRHLRSIFKALDGLMRNTAPILVGSQTLAVQHFHTWLPELTDLLSTEEILHIAIDFMDSCSSVKGKLVLYKLILIINYSRLDLFSQPDQRAALAANTVRWIAPHWGKTSEVTEQWRDQVRLCCSVLATQISMLGPEVPDHIPKIIDSYLAIQATPRQPKTRLSLLFPATYPFPTKPISGKPEFDEALVELSAVLSAISTLPSGMQLELAEDEMATLLDDTLRVHLSILHCEAFPASWLSVHIYHHKSTMKTLQYLAGILLESFLPNPDDAGLMSYNTELWKMFFMTLLKLVGSDSLALETFPEQKRRAVWKIAGDVREHGAELLRRTWEAIGWDTSADERHRYGLTKMGGYQVQYVPGLVGPIVELCLSVHEGLRHVAVEVLQTMIASEWNMSEDLSVIQTEMIDCLDQLFKSKPLTESILQKLFINELLDLFEPLSIIPDDPLYAALRDLVATIDEFLDLLVAVHSRDVTGEASHLMHRLRLMDFLRDMQKEEIFIRYVQQLATLQADARNFTEAGLALHLHADLYDWDPTRVLPASSDPEFPAQSQFERKERIYFDMIKYFEDGEAWSSALAAYKELQVQYEENIFDFSKLARTQRAIATIYESITKSDKIVPKYFRVTYKGMGFPVGLRDKDFVFEGSPTERTSAFTDRMQEQHPSAQIITTGDVEDVEGQFLQISPLSPHRNLDHHVFQRAKVPNVIREYLLSSHAQQFSTTTRRITTGAVSEHCAEKMVFTTADTFPTILRRSEIIQVERVKLSPIQTGLERIIRKTQEMASVEKRVADGEEEVIPLLIEALNISVNPTSESSVAKYRDLLPVSNNDEEEEPVEEVQLGPTESALKMALIDHAIMIKSCLTMFSKSSNSQLKSSYEELSRSE